MLVAETSLQSFGAKTLQPIAWHSTLHTWVWNICTVVEWRQAMWSSSCHYASVNRSLCRAHESLETGTRSSTSTSNLDGSPQIILLTILVLRLKMASFLNLQASVVANGRKVNPLLVPSSRNPKLLLVLSQVWVLSCWPGGHVDVNRRTFLPPTSLNHFVLVCNSTSGKSRLRPHTTSPIKSIVPNRLG